MFYVLIWFSPNVKTRLLFRYDRWSLHVVQHLESIITIQCTKNACCLFSCVNVVTAKSKWKHILLNVSHGSKTMYIMQRIILGTTVSLNFARHYHIFFV